MTKNHSVSEELTRYTALLEARIKELERGTCRPEEIAVEQSPDHFDQMQQAFARDLAITNIDRESRELRHIRTALRRIKEGTFGVCEHCDETIPPKRMAAIPWALLCVVCQEAIDRTCDEGGRSQTRS